MRTISHFLRRRTRVRLLNVGVATLLFCNHVHSQNDGTNRLASPDTTLAAPAGGRCVLPSGAGTKDGSSWGNALDASQNGLQRGWDALKPDETLWIGSGQYVNVTLHIKSGSEAGRFKKLIGYDSGMGRPIFVSTFDKMNPAKSGQTFLTAESGASQWWVQNIELRNYRLGLYGRGRHQNVRIINFDVTGCREGISLDAGATVENPALGSHDIEIRDCEFTHYTKRGIRFQNGNYHVRVINCAADAGGREWATEPFQMGFSVAGAVKSQAGVAGAPDHDLTFINCIARNNFNDAGTKYWNADGFVAESGVYNLRYTNCKAFDNTDGGWDDKSSNALLEGCVALRNKRNFRFWGSARMVRCLSAYAVHPGGNGSAAGLWASGEVMAERCTFHNNSIGIDVDEGGSVALSKCIVSNDRQQKGVLTDVEAKAQLKHSETTLWQEGEGGEAPQFVNPSPQWDGVGTNFNSKTFGAQKGYHSE